MSIRLSSDPTAGRVADMTATVRTTAPRQTPLQRVSGLGIGAIAAVQLITAGWMLIDPHGFHASVGAFGPYNGHYLRDAMAMFAGLGVALAASVHWTALRPGALAVATASIGFHAINHWVDIDRDHPGTSAGIVGALSQTVLAALCVALLRAELTRRASNRPS
jgi:hypothetical protein